MDTTDPTVETPKNRTLESIKKHCGAIAFTAVNAGLLLAIKLVGGRNLARLEGMPYDKGWNEGWDAALDELAAAIEYTRLAPKK